MAASFGIILAALGIVGSLFIVVDNEVNENPFFIPNLTDVIVQ
jgi:hypothetical protein